VRRFSYVLCIPLMYLTQKHGTGSVGHSSPPHEWIGPASIEALHAKGHACHSSRIRSFFGSSGTRVEL
jgi:hypothetical protein